MGFDSGNYFNQKYNDIYHEVDLYLDNSGDFENPKRFHINPAAVLGMVISETVNDWVTDGYLTFMYSTEEPPSAEANKTGQSSSTKTGLEKAASDNGKTLRNYQFRNDGYDLLRVRITPTAEKGQNTINVEKGNPKWTLSYLFSVYDIEDINNVPNLQGSMSTFLKCLKLKFHDFRYQLLKTSNIEYCTSEPKDKEYVPNTMSDVASPGQGVLYTGEILRDILNEVLSKPENGGHKDFFIEKNPELWDNGKSQLFYTSPAGYSAADDIDYVYSNHVATEELKGTPEEMTLNDLCLLHTERSSSTDKIEQLALTSLTSFFKKAGKEKNKPGDLQKEHFFVTALSEETTMTNLLKAPIGGNNVDIDVKTSRYGQILSFSFVDMAALTNTEMFRSMPVYSVDIGKREFNIEFKSNNIKAVKKIIAESYINELYKQGDNESLFLPVLHKTKKDLNVFPVFSLNGNNPLVRQKNGLHNLLYTGLFQNACICFKTFGLTLRESGTFIAIDKSLGSSPTDEFANKLYGQWFVVKVEHVFEAGMYMNVIYAIKIHRYAALTLTKFSGLLEENV